MGKENRGNYVSEYLTPEEMNKLLTYCKEKGRIFISDNANNLSYYQFCVLQLGKVKITAITEYKNTIHDFYTFLDGREDPQVIDGKTAYISLKRSYPELHVIEDETLTEQISASPLIGYNETYSGQRIEAWGYDLNSAYSAAMLRGWIDTTTGPEFKEIDPLTEIGFDFNLDIQREGLCPFVFKKMETPKAVENWVKRYYQQKKMAKTKEEKLKAKQTLNYAVGMLQIKNPWLRAWIVSSCNELIKSLIDENTLFWNTDSIVSKVPRPELEIGDEVGQWKLEHSGVVAYVKNTYQWNNDKPTYRGVPKTWFSNDYDLLVDGKPENQNLYYFDKENIIICQNCYMGSTTAQI